MNTSKITNIVIAHLNESGTRFALGWEYNGAQYHIWLDPLFNLTDDKVLYKNPLSGIKTGGVGYFPTRQLSPFHAVNSAMIAHVFDFARRKNDLLGDALLAQAKQKAAEKAANELAALERRKQDAGPEMYDLLCRLYRCIFPDDHEIRALLERIQQGK